MQSKYVGDKSDFAKFGLLRRISGLTDPETLKPDLSLGIVWYLRPDECYKRDGGNIGYLCDTNRNREQYRECDPFLWEELKSLVDHSRRCVHKIPKREILPDGTLFYDCPLYFPDYFTTLQSEEARERWLQAALRKMDGTAIVYLDPDTGIAPENKRPTHRDGSKYTYPEDIQRFWNEKRSLVIYQHLGRSDVEEQIRRKVMQLREICGVEPMAMRFGSSVFFILASECHREYVRPRVRRMVTDGFGWGRHFVLIVEGLDV